MKKFTITSLLALLVCTAAVAQTKLQNGAPSNLAVVKLPYFFYDLMRNEHNAWIRQYRPNAQVQWENSNLLINRKDAQGRFEYLEYSLWDWNIEQWLIYNKYIYDRQSTNGNLTFQKTQSWYRGQDDQLRNFVTEENYVYENGVMKSGTSSLANEGGTVSDVNRTFFYDNQARRIHDSESYDFGAYAYRSLHLYNAPGGKCSDTYFLFNSDTMLLTSYGYDANGRVSRYADYRYQGNTSTLRYEELYTYDAQGRIQGATFSYRDSVGFNPVARYEHGYNALGKLEWMTLHEFSNNAWFKSDSVFITYNGTHADTSYGYVSTNGLTWHNYPNFRFLFDETMTGMKDPVKTNLSFTLYPNPATDKLTVSLDENKPVENIVITDVLGKQVAAYSGVQTADISRINPGIYFVRVETKDAVGIKKLLIE